MKLSFSTRGWNDHTFDGYLDIADEMDFAGIEIYSLTQERFYGKGQPFDRYNLAATTRQLRDRKL